MDTAWSRITRRTCACRRSGEYIRTASCASRDGASRWAAAASRGDGDRGDLEPERDRGGRPDDGDLDGVGAGAVAAEVDSRRVREDAVDRRASRSPSLSADIESPLAWRATAL